MLFYRALNIHSPPNPHLEEHVHIIYLFIHSFYASTGRTFAVQSWAEAE